MPLFEADQLLKSADAEYRCPGLSFSPLGMSPKKYHEVSRMTTYVLELMERVSGSTGISVQHIVDIGAGQGYLSRSLCSSLKAHVLALDSSPHQTEVAARRFQQTDAASSERKEKGKGTSSKRSDPTTISDSTSVSGGSLNFRTITKSGYMVADLEQTIGDWLSDCGTEEERNAANDLGRPTPIILVALHACGSLTPTIFRKLFDLRQEKYSGSGNKTFKPRPWFVAAAVIVGCCYNLIEKDGVCNKKLFVILSHRRVDLHLSSFVKTQIKEQHISFTLTPSHLQLAAQVPSQWLRTPEKTSATELAVKKVLYRALVTPCLQQAMDSRSETGPALPRLGKFNSKAYESFGVFLHYASQKIGVDFVGQYTEDNSDLETVCSTPLARRIETIHAMRCLLGPPVESLIILDRLLWIQESLREEANSYPMGVQLVNLFDQGVDSGRNIGIVLYPQGNSCQS
ncbi:methyltransferase domain-containing protein [Phellopilus nigrolimitatus]|nr:methyltransferase domain-containing protein [Phellopilus nigrolimitatus]